MRGFTRLFFVLLLTAFSAADVASQPMDVARGVQLYQEGQYGEAAVILSHALAQDSSMVELYPPLVASYYRLDRTADARRLVDAGLRRAPVHVLLNLLKADLLLEKERLEEALHLIDGIVQRAMSGQASLPQGVSLDELQSRSGYLHLHVGILKGDGDDWQAATGHFRAARRLIPDELQVHRSLAYAYLQMEAWDAVQEATRDGLHRFPADDGLTRMRIHALAELGDSASLQEETARLYQRNPDDAQLALTHAQVLLTAGDYAGAQAVFEDVLRRHPENREVYDALAGIHRSMMNADALLDLLKRMQAVFPDDLDIPIQIAAVHETRGNLDAARSVYESLIVDHPEHAEAYLRLATTYEMEDEPGEAIRVYRNMFAALPDHREALVRLGGILKASGELDEARVVFERLRRTGVVSAHIDLGEIFDLMGNAAEADRHFQLAVDAGTGHPLPYLRLAEIALERGDTEKAFKMAERALYQSLNSVERVQEALMNRLAGQAQMGFGGLDSERLRMTAELDRLDDIASEAFTFFTSGFPEERVQPVLTAIIQQHGTSGRLHLILAQFYLRTDNTDAALEYLRTAVDVTPELREAHVMLAQLLETRGDLTGAERAWERALSLDATRGDAYDALIRIASLSGRESQLLRRWNARLRAEPDNDVLRRYLIELLHQMGRQEETRALTHP